MGLFTPKYPSGSEPARQPSRSERRNERYRAEARAAREQRDAEFAQWLDQKTQESHEKSRRTAAWMQLMNDARRR